MKSWQVQHGAAGFLLPLALVVLLVALRFNLIPMFIRRIRLFLQLRSARSTQSNPQLASRLYTELLRTMARRGLMRIESQTPFEFAAAVRAPNLASPVYEFTQIYAHARFGDVPCDTTRLRQLLDQVRMVLRSR
jgi:hypothetical protein